MLRCASFEVTEARSVAKDPLTADTVPDALAIVACEVLLSWVEYLRHSNVLRSCPVLVAPRPVHLTSSVIGSARTGPPAGNGTTSFFPVTGAPIPGHALSAVRVVCRDADCRFLLTVKPDDGITKQPKALPPAL